MNDKSSEEEPKLIIDEDWKSQVQREKEELKRKQSEQASDAESSADDAADAASAEAEGSTSADLPLPPPASLPLLVTSLATQAMASLGQLPDDEGKTLPVNLAYARHFIDLIGVLEEKTKGNLTDEESSMIQDALHQMRMLYVAISKQQAG